MSEGGCCVVMPLLRERTKTDDMIADIFTKALPRGAHEKHMNTMLNDLPQSAVDMALSSKPQVPPEDRKVENVDCNMLLEGVPEFEGSPSPEESCDDQKRVMEYACMARVGLGRVFHDILMVAMAEDF